MGDVRARPTGIEVAALQRPSAARAGPLSAAELGRAAWPVELLAAGMALMIAAANYAPLKVRLIAQAKLRRP
jgi:hypothetical protein